MSETGPRLMDEGDFRKEVGDVLHRLLNQVDEIESDDLDARLSEGNLVVSFESGGTVMLSQQTPTRELWLSANLRAWHFRLADGQWLERDSGEPMTAVLGGIFSGKVNQAIHFEL